MNDLLAIQTNIGEVAIYALLGFAIVFLGIALLVFVVWLVGKIMGGAAAKAPAPAPKTPKQAPAPAIPVKKTEENGVDDETVAVITAAIMAYYRQNNQNCEFIVRRIKRI